MACYLLIGIDSTMILINKHSNRIKDSVYGAKYNGCLSSKHSANNLLQTENSINPFRMTNDESSHQIKDKEEVFINSSNLSASGSKFKNNSPSRSKDTSHFKQNPKAISSSYIYSNRYRSISFQNKLEFNKGKYNHNVSYEESQDQERRSYHYKNRMHSKVSAGETEHINFGAKARARKAHRNKEFEQIYKESTEGALKSPPMMNAGTKATLKLDVMLPSTSRKSLANRSKEESQRRTLYHQMEALTSDRSQPTFHYPENILAEKDIPDEGNACQPELHRIKLNDFHCTGQKLKMSDLNQKPSRLHNASFEANLKVEKLYKESKNRKVRNKRNFDENIEPDRVEKFVNIKSSEDFWPGRNHKEEQSRSNSGWSFWKTLKNPLQWFGMSDDTTPDPQESENLSNNTESSRTRSISHSINPTPRIRNTDK